MYSTGVHHNRPVTTTTVPRPLTSFIGRERDVAAIRALLADNRLLTLTGAGGIGKTRLASEVAATIGNAAWVELAPLRDPLLVPTAVVVAAGIEQGSRTASEALLDALRDRELLLILDNCEHLVDACAHLADTILHASPGVRILATSREALGVAGERAWLVPGLTVPSVAEGASDPGASEAVRLFVDRARAASARFQLTEANAAAIAQICRRLDGLPLAIELAAARVRSLPPEQLAARLDASLGVLTTGPRNAVPRHRTLHAAIQWSYDLLGNLECMVLQRLSVFAGDFTLEAAERVCSVGVIEEPEVLELIAALVDKSLIVMREEGGTARFYLLETIRQYARQRLVESGDAEVVFARHARAYLALVADAEPHFITRQRRRWVELIQRELDNVRAALAFTREHDPALHVELAGRLSWFWYSSGFWAEGRLLLENAISISANCVAQDRVRVLFGGGVLASLQADADRARGWLEECAALATSVADLRSVAYARAYIGVAYGQSGHDAALVPLEAALGWFRQAGDLYGLRLSLVVLSTYHLVRGDLDRALEEAEEAARIAREFGLDRELAIALQVLATVVLTTGDLRRAAELFRETLAALGRDPSPFWAARALLLLGVVTCRLGDPLLGARFLGAAESCRGTIGADLFPHDRERLAPVVTTARDLAGSDAFDQAWAAGRALSVEAATALALSGVPGAGAPVVERSGTAPSTLPARARFALEVRALGALQISVDGITLQADTWRYVRPRELLLYLLSHPEGYTRDQIGLTFWPESSATQVKNSFHVTLHHLRRALGRADLIGFEGDRYRIAWKEGVWFDAQEFETTVEGALKTLGLRRGRDASASLRGSPRDDPERTASGSAVLDELRAALELYRGDFLADERAGDWHLEYRDRLRQLYTRGTLLVAAGFEADKRYDEAVEAYRRVIAADELHEEAHRRLMLALARNGERSSALRQYERLSSVLRKELAALPESATTAVYDRIRGTEPV